MKYSGLLCQVSSPVAFTELLNERISIYQCSQGKLPLLLFGGFLLTSKVLPTLLFLSKSSVRPKVCFLQEVFMGLL